MSATAEQDRGQVMSYEPGLDAWAPALPAGTRTTRIVYRSVSGVTGAATTVSGAVFVPRAGRPAGGWPLIAYAHGTTGITRDCGPSDQPDMFGDLHAVRSLLDAGYAVVTTDYQGLGLRTDEPQPHPYLEPRTAAYNVIDAVRAARSIEPTVGTRWLAVGASQGGAAAWSTAETYASYGKDSGDLVGAVAVSPLLDGRYLVDRAQTSSLTVAQRYLYPLLVAGVEQAQRGDTAEPVGGTDPGRFPAAPSCTNGKTALAGQVSPPAPSVLTVTAGKADGLSADLGADALPKVRTDVPILAIYGSADDVIPVDVMEVTLARGCGLGDRLQRIRRDGQGHSLDPGPQMATWMHDRVVGRPVTSDC